MAGFLPGPMAIFTPEIVSQSNRRAEQAWAKWNREHPESVQRVLQRWPRKNYMLLSDWHCLLVFSTPFRSQHQNCRHYNFDIYKARIIFFKFHQMKEGVLHMIFENNYWDCELKKYIRIFFFKLFRTKRRVEPYDFRKNYFWITLMYVWRWNMWIIKKLKQFESILVTMNWDDLIKFILKCTISYLRNAE